MRLRKLTSILLIFRRRTMLIATLIASFIIQGFSLEESIAGNGDNPGITDTEYGKLEMIHSDTMNIDLPALVFIPDSYEESDEPYKVVYFLHGVNKKPMTEEGLREIYNPKTKVKELANDFNVIIVAPITGNSYYLDSPLKPKHKFATYCGKEVPAYIDKKYNTVKSREGRILAGFSMGGYGAVSLLCRFPDDFSAALARAGVLNLATGVEDLYWDDVSENLVEILGDYWESKEAWHKNSCHNMINHIRHREDIALVIEVGTDDFLYKTNHSFKDRLNELNIPHIYTEYPGGHTWSANALRSLLIHLQYFNQTIEY